MTKVSLLATLYASHLVEKMSRFQAILTESKFTGLVISSGEQKIQFEDDLFYPFKANPYFREWVPLNKRAGSFLQLELGASKPRLFLLCAEDIWHTERQQLPAGFEEGLDIVEFESLDEIKGLLNPQGGGTAFVGETNLLRVPNDYWNPQAVITAIDFQRQSKTAYEQDCVRKANHLAAPAHKVAHEAFMTGASELEIGAAYLRACNASENDMPYSIIAGVNEHAAVLHHQQLQNVAMQTPRSFLIDAGVDVNGYASDITRTYAYDKHSEFSDMIRLLDVKQQELVAAGAIGRQQIDLHRLYRQKIAEVLNEFGVLKASVDEAVETNLVEAFSPHGLGHHLGCNVHDKGSCYVNATGDVVSSPTTYPTFRHTAPMVANQIHTVEPGLYFIPALLNKLRGSKTEKQINWNKIEAFLPYGGIRIEDNIVVHEDGSLENLTRNAFSKV